MYWRLISCLFIFFIVFPSLSEATPEVEQFQTTWIAKALRMQREIDLDIPLNQATFLATHNSENALSYQIPFVRYVDPNQILSIYDQLEMGVRSIEYDVHWYTGAHFQKDILLCHGLPNHLGCSSFDRPVTEGLEELRNWLQKNPGEVVLLYFDRGVALDGHEPRLAYYLQQYLGDYIYKPTLLRQSALPACMSLPGTLTKADVLKAGKQLIIITKACDDTASYQEQETYKLNWNDYVFAGMGNVPNHPFDILDSTIGDDFTQYPDCSTSTTFADDKQHSVMWRIFEDRTLIGSVVSPKRKLLATDMQTMVRCGINWQTMDMLTANDDRLAAAVWSWAPYYPHEGHGDCALYQDSNIINDSCEKVTQGFACKNSVTNVFRAIKVKGQWKDGETNCQSLGPDWHFAMPVNGHQMYLLAISIAGEGMTQAWLKYHATGTGHWQAN